MAQVDVAIVIPVFEEAESLPELANEIAAACDAASLSFEVLLIDDGSRDRSWRAICSIHGQDARFRGIRLRRNYGKSAALAAGFAHADARVVVTMDADLQDDPVAIGPMVEEIDSGLDLVSGWKQHRRDPLSKKLPSRLFNLVTRLVSGVRLHDFNCGLKAYRLEVVRALRIYGEMHRYIPLLVKWAGFDRIGELPVAHRARRFGRSKFGLERYMRGCLDLVTVTFLTRFGARPMHLFGSLGLLAFVLGFALCLWISVEKVVGGTPIGDRPALLLGALLILVGFQAMSTGFIADLIIRQRMEREAPFKVAETAGFTGPS